MKKKQINFSTFVFIFVILILLIASYKIYSYTDGYKVEIQDLKSQLKDQNELSAINQLTNEFIEKSSVGQHGKLLTGKAKEEYVKALENKGLNENEHLEEEGNLERSDLINVFVNKTDEKTARSYAIYKAYYSNNPNSQEINTQRILFLSLTADWIKTNKGFKVYDYKIDLLKDSLDDQLKKMSENTSAGE